MPRLCQSAVVFQARPYFLFSLPDLSCAGAGVRGATLAEEASSSTANMSASAHAQNGHHHHFQKTPATFEKKSSSDEELMQVSPSCWMFVWREALAHEQLQCVHVQDSRHDEDVSHTSLLYSPLWSQHDIHSDQIQRAVAERLTSPQAAVIQHRCHHTTCSWTSMSTLAVPVMLLPLPCKPAGAIHQAAGGQV